MKLFHYTSNPIIGEFDYDKCRSGVMDMKPAGLWVSVGEDWAEWCVAEEYHLDGLKYKYSVELVENAAVHIITDETDLANFDLLFNRNNLKDPMVDLERIDWERVMAKYDGLIIAPYIYESRLSFMWYYGWDCASGCIWNPKAVYAIHLVE